MDEHIRTVYLTEAVTQCKFALNAIAGLRNVLPRIGPAARAGDFNVRQTLHEEVFRSLHSFLTHASNVSRLFWPPSPRRKERESEAEYEARCKTKKSVARAVALREAVGLGLDHPLRSRALRDHLEHFDERLDHWAENSRRKNYIQDLIGGPNAIVGVDPDDIMRWFDPTAQKIRFRGQEYDLRALADAVADVSDLCVTVLEGQRSSVMQEIPRTRPDTSQAV